MKILKQKLAVARAQHAACKSPCPMPSKDTLNQARKYRDHTSLHTIFGGFEKRSLREHGSMRYLVEALNDAERYATYKMEKARLAQVIADIQAEILAALTSQPSDLE
jgi:cell fate (sporulation/competence/biofilm development) regulator YlbF (YheA/YmcA/DUF963 family)